MLDVRTSCGRVPSDKDFDTVFGLVDKSAAKFFVAVLKKDMNLFGILTDERVIDDVLEIGIRSIDVDSKEYFIRVLLDKEYLDELHGRYELDV
ncbi:MAG: hypothetical protein V3T58_07550 [Candidatus Hydrothermarchaeales archaeon]